MKAGLASCNLLIELPLSLQRSPLHFSRIEVFRYRASYFIKLEPPIIKAYGNYLFGVQT